jgi:hypothetical protein
MPIASQCSDKRYLTLSASSPASERSAAEARLRAPATPNDSLGERLPSSDDDADDDE